MTEHYREVVRIAELADQRGAVSDRRFIDCEINGPALLVPIRDVHLSDIVLDVPSVDAAFIELADDASLVVMIPLFNVEILRGRGGRHCCLPPDDARGLAGDRNPQHFGARLEAGCLEFGRRP